jgi:hypothetical protein
VAFLVERKRIAHSRIREEHIVLIFRPGLVRTNLTGRVTQIAFLLQAAYIYGCTAGGVPSPRPPSPHLIGEKPQLLLKYATVGPWLLFLPLNHHDQAPLPKSLMIQPVPLPRPMSYGRCVPRYVIGVVIR